MELVQLDGYTEDEKVTIAKHHLFPRQREKAGLRADELELTDAAFHALVSGWTREAGVRGSSVSSARSSASGAPDRDG